MLKADITLSDLSLSAEWRDGSIALGTSRIIPYAHPMLETALVRTEGQWFVTVRERLAPVPSDKVPACRDVDAEEFQRLYQECILWPLDYVLIEVAQAGCRMRVRTGVLGSVPVYCRAANDKVTISWDFADFANEPLAIDAEIASHRLALSTIYSARQLCVGVTLLTERASFHVEPGKANYRYPVPMEETSPSPLPEGQDALRVFSELLQRVVSARPIAMDRVSIELSGGMDSATVACAVAAFHGRMASKGILLDGDVRQPQIQRRQWITSRLDLSDETVEIAAFPPNLDLQEHQARGLYWEYYLEACTALWESARVQGHDMLFTGIGGDELFPGYANEKQEEGGGKPGKENEATHYAERLMTPRALSAARSMRCFDAPASPVPATALLAHACRAPDLLRHGLWPVNPLSDPGLVAFCHRLPRDSRQGREVMRQYLHARLGSEVFPRSYIKETFARVLPDLISRQAATIASQLRDCALADLGLVDQRAALALLDTVAATRAQAPTAALASFLWMERCVRQIR
ncbi:asparagine synthase (glutamine-hydrolysing) [Luteibacter rhizovicinus]|uniref:Asparagine synthase (Glutamine-hydrolysing) n=1 Tax=Luteibacter rhizovicinus TaxID=242606 RepID=A0A4R3Z1I1_9GAMM|nr:asparagine synthase-related protein [Luteibacter rhizovicinus]TCV97704.1 asparagine synthase (glutamine-hydrolysing) [Luteibacter rhizovicinus]